MSDELQLPQGSTAPAAARRFVRSWLLSRDLEPLLDTAVLLVSEVVANAVLHTTGASTLRLSAIAGGVRVEVDDASPVPPSRRRHSTDATTGRGCQLLTDLSDDWGFDPTPTGKTVWFTVTGANDPWAAFSGTDWIAELEA